MSKNSIEIDYTDNAEVMQMLQGQDIGSSVELKVTIQLNQKDDKRAVGTIEEIEVVGAGEVETDEDETEVDGESGGPPTSVEPGADEPVSMMLSMRAKRKPPTSAGA